MEKVLELKNVSKIYSEAKNITNFLSKSDDQFVAVDNVSFSLESKKVLGLVGESGSGKSTCALMAMKLLDITEGEIFVNNNNITNRNKDQLYKKNLLMDKDELIPYATMDRTFLINKVKVLNHKWLIANFSDGTLWGELLIFFKVDKSGDISFELKEHFLYPTRE